MFIRFKFFDQGDGGGAPAPVPGSVATPTSVSQPQTQAAPAAAPAVPTEPAQPAPMDDFRTRTQSYIERWRRENQVIQPDKAKGTEPTHPITSNPASPVMTPPSVPATTPINQQAPATPEPPKAPEQPPVQAQEPQKPAEQTPAEQKILKLCGNDWTVEQAEQHLRYAHSALQREAEIAAKEEEFETMMKSPDVVILQELKNDPDLRAKVIELMSGEHQDAAANLAAREAQAQVEALQNQILTMRQQLQAKEQADMQREQERQLQQQTAWAQGVVSNVKNALDSQAKSLGVPDDMVQLVGAKVKAAVEGGVVPFEQQKLTEYGFGLLKTIADHINAQQRRVQEQYLKGKQQLPPPPPQGGAPAMGNAAPRTFADARRRSQERISTALGEFGR